MKLLKKFRKHILTEPNNVLKKYLQRNQNNYISESEINLLFYIRMIQSYVHTFINYNTILIHLLQNMCAFHFNNF